jgi:hypothetical protein
LITLSICQFFAIFVTYALCNCFVNFFKGINGIKMRNI